VSASYELLGNREITLPGYMNMLEPDDDSHKASYGPIIACGIQPETTTMVSITNTGEFYELDLKKFFSTDDFGDEVYPVAKGRIIEFIRKDMIVTVESKDILIASQKLELINLKIGMSHENKDADPEKNYQGRNGT